MAVVSGPPPCRHARYNLAPGLGRLGRALSWAGGCCGAGWKAPVASGLVIPAMGAWRWVCGMLKAEITLRASSFTNSHKSSNCRTRHKETGQMLAHSQWPDAHLPSTRTPSGRISFDLE